MSKIRIGLTGGGTAGHVTPNIALLNILYANNWEVDYIGSQNGVEKKMIQAIEVPYYQVRSGKLRRYFSWQNFLDPFNLLIGIVQSYFLLKKLELDIVFSKGGFVALPVVIASYMRRIPVVIHESDMTPGLANKLSFPFASKICVNFAATKKYIKNGDKVDVTGTPIRAELFKGIKEKGLQLCGFNDALPVLLVVGGSLGSKIINNAIRESLTELLKKYQVMHICGKNNIDPDLENRRGYKQIEYANSEMADLFSAADIVVSRSGANFLCELLALHKPHVLIPLSSRSSRGDQIYNADYFAKEGISIVIPEEELNHISLFNALQECQQNSAKAIKIMEKLGVVSASEKIFKILTDLVADRA